MLIRNSLTLNPTLSNVLYHKDYHRATTNSDKNSNYSKIKLLNCYKIMDKEPKNLMIIYVQRLLVFAYV